MPLTYLQERHWRSSRFLVPNPCLRSHLQPTASEISKRPWATSSIADPFPLPPLLLYRLLSFQQKLLPPPITTTPLAKFPFLPVKPMTGRLTALAVSLSPAPQEAWAGTGQHGSPGGRRWTLIPSSHVKGAGRQATAPSELLWPMTVELHLPLRNHRLHSHFKRRRHLVDLAPPGLYPPWPAAAEVEEKVEVQSCPLLHHLPGSSRGWRVDMRAVRETVTAQSAWTSTWERGNF